MSDHVSASDSPLRATEGSAPTTTQHRAATVPGRQEHPGAPTHAAHVSHGNTLDAWTGVLILLAGSLAVCVGMVLASIWGAAWTWLWVVGAILCVVGVVAWVGMHRAGMTRELF